MTLLSDNTVLLASCPQQVMQPHKHAIGAETTADHCLLVVQLGEEIQRAKVMRSRLVSMHAVAVTPQLNFCCFCLSCAPAASESMVALHQRLRSATVGNLPQK